MTRDGNLMLRVKRHVRHLLTTKFAHATDLDETLARVVSARARGSHVSGNLGCHGDHLLDVALDGSPCLCDSVWF